MKRRTTIIETIIFLYTFLFLYTGISKLIAYDVFRENISDSPILAPFATPIAWGLPWLEFGITILMIIPRWRLKGLYAALVIMALFTVYVIAILIFDQELPCSCGGIIQQLSWPQHLIFNGMFIVLAAWALILQKREKKQQQINWFNQYPLPNHEN
ncbi:MauE/DoxX family redox-associated membrane protein [Niastella vici]|uniref:MauE/DoxX family redox-associated membrane protein n=1 Tax=Niastella vici TaxID=1703345 RepID=UPI0011815C75|nr:MauE/DoxX family redox-associated membrane protein [Niastella vici]